MYCGGMGKGRELLTHTGYVELLKGRAYATTSGPYLISMSMLDKLGCAFVGGGGTMSVLDRDGLLMFEGRLGPNNMYTYKMPVLQRESGIEEVKRGCLRVLERWENRQTLLSAHPGQVHEKLEHPVTIPEPTAVEQTELIEKTNGRVQLKGNNLTANVTKRGIRAREMHCATGHP